MSWIKLHRDIKDSQVFAHPTIFKIWCWLLIKAHHTEKHFSLKAGRGYTNVTIKRGQLLFGRHKAEEELDIDGSTIYRHIQTLEKWGNVIIESNNQYSIITICKYDEYQTNDGEDEQQINNERTTKEQRNDSKGTTNGQRNDSEMTANEHKEEAKEAIECKEGEEGEEEEDEKSETDFFTLKKNSLFNNVMFGQEMTEINKNGDQEILQKMKKETTEPLFKNFMAFYFEWMEKEIGIKPQIDGGDGKALKSIIKYFRSISEDETAIIQVWETILINYKKWDNFHQKQLRLKQINSNLINIINSIKNGKQSITDGKSITQQREEIGNID